MAKGRKMDFIKGVDAYFSTVTATILQIDQTEIDAAMNQLLAAYERGSAIYCFGNGGSAATASHMLNDFNTGISYGLDKKFKVHCLNDNIATLTALANDIGYEFIFSKQLEGKLQAGDLIVAISVSGNSSNVIRAVEYAKACKCGVIGITGYDGGILRKLADYHMHVPSHDMQVVEDIHMIFNHMMTKLFCQTLG